MALTPSVTPYPVSGNSINIAAVNMNLLPIGRNEQSKIASTSIYWNAVYQATGALYATINLLQQYQSGNFTTVQAVWIDNSTVPGEFVLTCLETGQVIRVAAFAQGMYPLLASTSPTFGALFNGLYDPVYGTLNGGCTTEIFFLNTPQRYLTIPQALYGQNWSQYLLAGTITSGTAKELTATGGGIGMQSLGYPFYYAITVMEVTLTLFTAITAVWQCPIGLEEKDNSGPYQRYSDIVWAPSGSIGTMYRTTWNFPSPLIQIDYDNNWYFIYNSLPTNSGSGFFFNININFGSVQIS